MLSIISIGVSNSETPLTDKDLNALSGEGLKQPPLSPAFESLLFEKRYVTLPHNYLKITKNHDIRLSEMVARKTVSQMGVEAVKKACELAGIGIDQIGLVIADTATLLQTTPAESQRIIGELGLKIPCFDIIGLSSALPLHLETIDSWKKEKVPEYAVIVSTNTPSHFIDYTKNDAYFFGDHATAIVISNVHDGYFNLKKATYNKFNGYSLNGKSFTSAELLGIPTSKHLNFNAEKYIEFQLSELTNSTRAIKNYGYNLSFVVTDQINSQLASEIIAKELGSEVKHINTVSSYGYAFGSTAGATLNKIKNCEIKEEVEIGDMIAVITAGAGLNSGYALLQRE